MKFYLGDFEEPLVAPFGVSTPYDNKATDKWTMDLEVDGELEDVEKQGDSGAATMLQLA